MTNILAFSEHQSRKGVCADCLWVCGPLRDSCDHPNVGLNARRPMIKALAARKSEEICGSQGKAWEARK
jgi:hypothetical protein